MTMLAARFPEPKQGVRGFHIGPDRDAVQYADRDTKDNEPA